jgi:hypothetical protein
MTDGWTAVASSVIDGKVVESRFSVAEAKRAKLWDSKDVWKQYPRRMLWWRAVGHHVADYYSAVLLGFPIAEAIDTAGGAADRAQRHEPPRPAPDPLFDEEQG